MALPPNILDRIKHVISTGAKASITRLPFLSFLLWYFLGNNAAQKKGVRNSML